ncbi:MAG: threonine aldolase, partial [Deltaproteobacteria bacterium]|nr:threonine aldolase [Deltaproteobacteria bacterium]
GLSIEPDSVKTNIVFFETTGDEITAEILSEKLDADGVRILPTSQTRLRAVTHYHVTSDDIGRVVSIFQKILSS